MIKYGKIDIARLQYHMLTFAKDQPHLINNRNTPNYKYVSTMREGRERGKCVCESYTTKQQQHSHGARSLVRAGRCDVHLTIGESEIVILSSDSRYSIAMIIIIIII